jgi:hypothetical protein
MPTSEFDSHYLENNTLYAEIHKTFISLVVTTLVRKTFWCTQCALKYIFKLVFRTSNKVVVHIV